MKLYNRVIYKDYYDNDRRKIGIVREINIKDVLNAEGGSMGNTVVQDEKTGNQQLHWESELVELPEKQQER